MRLSAILTAAIIAVCALPALTISAKADQIFRSCERTWMGDHWNRHCHNHIIRSTDEYPALQQRSRSAPRMFNTGPGYRNQYLGVGTRPINRGPVASWRPVGRGTNPGWYPVGR